MTWCSLQSFDKNAHISSVWFFDVQNEVYQSDFTHERQDRQRVMGELDAVQKELRRTKKLLKHQEQEVR